MCPLWRGESNGKLLNFKGQGERSRRTPKDLYIQTIIGGFHVLHHAFTSHSGHSVEQPVEQTHAHA
jgi:hypothetical protein